MFNRLAQTTLLICMTMICLASPASAQVGMPTGSFNLKITHGAFVLNNGVTVPGDVSATDGDPEDFVQIGTVNNDPVILKMVADGTPDFRLVHLFISVPASLDNVYESGGTSLFDPLDPSPISVEVSGMSFLDTTAVIPVVVNSAGFMTAYMRDTSSSSGGLFYDLPNGSYVAPGVFGPEPQVQVTGDFFNDGNPSQYQFTMMSYNDPTASWRWGNIPNAMGSDVISLAGTSPGDGRVFELGLSIGFVGVPEPGTLALLVPGMMLILFPPKRRS